MIYVTGVKIEPNPVKTGGEITVEVEIAELYPNAKRYPNKYPHRYNGASDADE